VLKKSNKTILYAVLILLGGYMVFLSGRVIYATRFAGIEEFGQTERIFGAGDQELRLIAAGDSLALGFGASSLENSMAYMIADELSEESKVIYRNVAKDGAQTKNVVKSQLGKIADFKPDIVVITIGGNDAVRLKSSSKILRNYEEITEYIKANTDATLYISNVPNFNDAEILPAWHREAIDGAYKGLNKEILELQGDRVIVIDAYSRYENTENPQDTFAKDRFHPNDYGHKIWAEAFLERIKNER